MFRVFSAGLFVQEYVRHIRPHCDPVDDSLFAGVKSNPISQINQCIRWLGGKYEVVTPTCTQLRKVEATEAALQCSESARHLISQMAHSVVVHTKHYEKIRGSKEAPRHTQRGKGWLLSQTMAVSLNLWMMMLGQGPPSSTRFQLL